MPSSIPREYESCGLLGQGAFSVVYRARHLPSGRLVALKCLKMPRAVFLPLLRREIQALRRLRHPGVVRILDSGTQDGVPWYSMELIAGPTLRDWLQPLGLVERLGPLLDLVSALCEALAYVHGEGIVHRDLKPENVLVSAERRPVLVDFGFVTEFAAGLPRESLNLDTRALGTALYMAPEQIQGELVDARADLYSLGCLLYEMLSGRPPFTGTAEEVREAHLGHAPRPLQDLAPWVPEPLNELVGRLLRKDRRERFGYAADVAATLVGLGADRPAAGPEPRPYLYRPSFVGRKQVLEQLDACLTQLEGGLGGAVLVAGESGGGKTRLLIELGRRAMKRKLRVLAGECPPDGVRALEVLRKPLQTLADWCRQQGRDATLRLLGPGGRLLGRYEPQLLELDGVRQATEPVELPAEASRLRLFHALDHAFGSWAEERPLLLALDDLHWADELSLGWVEHFWRARRWPLLVIGAYRPEDLGAQKAAPLKRLLEGLAAGGQASVQLGRLEPEALDSMASDMLALETISSPFAAFLQRQSNGNPLFLGEYLRTAVAEDVLYRDEQGRWQVSEPGDAQATASVFESLPLPGALRELLARRLQGLGATARAVVDCAAVLGRESDEALLGRMMRAGAEKRLEAARELLARQVMEDSGAGRLRFAHDKLREVAYERLAQPRRKGLHRKAAEQIEAHFGSGSAEQQAVLGHHWERGGVAEKARRCYLAAARRAVQLYAHEEPERLYRAYLRLVQKPEPESIAARNELAERVLGFQGRRTEALAEHQSALDEARAIGDAGAERDSLQKIGISYTATGRLDEAQLLFEQVLALYRENGDRGPEGEVLIHLSRVCYLRGQPQEARAFGEQALAIHRQLRNRKSEGRALSTLGSAAAQGGHGNEARAFYAEALLIARELGERPTEGTQLGNLAMVEVDAGNFEEANELYRQALVLQRELGNRPAEALLLTNLGRALHDQGRYEEARTSLERALFLSREMGERHLEAAVLANIASTHFEEERLDEAEKFYQQALELAREVGGRVLQSNIEGCLGEVFEEQGRLEEARKMYEQSLAFDLESGRRRHSEGLTLCLLAKLGRRQGFDLVQADRLAETSEKLLSEFAGPSDLAALLCVRGHIALGQGRSGREFLKRAQALIGTLSVAPGSSLAKAAGRLQRAVEAFEAGRPLFRGELLEDMPEGLRRWLKQQDEAGDLIKLGGGPASFA